jgi:hypothetical protein
MVKNRNLSRAVSDMSFSEFRRQLTYKAYSVAVWYLWLTGGIQVARLVQVVGISLSLCRFRYAVGRVLYVVISMTLMSMQPSI